MTPPPPEFELRVLESFGRQKVMVAIGARMTRVSAGAVDIELPFREDLTQQHGFIHAGIVTTIVDSACGYSALSVMAPDAAVLTVELKINFLAPAKGEKLIARGRVVRPGRTIVACAGDVVAVAGGIETPVATMLATMMAVRGRGLVG